MSNSAAPIQITSITKSEERSPRNWIGAFFKRIFDILASATGMLILSPLYSYLVIRVRRDSPGPALYSGARAGRSGKTFNILKFRTMHDTSDSYNGPPITAQDDPRITSLGKWLRDTKLNELPQLLNVLKGEMSLVGPRPEDPTIAAGWPVDVQNEVLSVRPGVTSPASVLYRDEEAMLQNSKVMEDYLEDILPSKLRLDQLYVRHHSFWGDLDILIWTLLILLPRLRKYDLPELSLFVGPVSRLMRRHISWFAIDTLVTFIAMGLIGLFWRSLGPLDIGWSVAVVLAFGFSFLFSLTNAILGVNRIQWSRAAATDALDLIPGVSLATVIALLINYYSPPALVAFLFAGEIPEWFTQPLLPAGLLIMASGLSLFGFIIVRYRTRLITGLATRWVTWRGTAAAAKERILILGGGETGQFAAWILNHGTYSESFSVAGFVDDDLYMQDFRIHGINVLGRREDIPELINNHDIGIIIFAIHNISSLERRHLLEICAKTEARIFLFPDIPASLSKISRNGSQAGEIQTNAMGSYDRFQDIQPCRICSEIICPHNLDIWLAKLEKTAQFGDIENLLEQIQQMRWIARSDPQTRDGHIFDSEENA